MIGLPGPEDGIGDLLAGSADLDGDGIPDMTLINTDIDGDGVADISQFDLDIDGDGVADVSLVMADRDGDGMADMAFTDLDGDGVADIFASGDAAQAVWDGVEDAAELGAMADPFDDLGDTYSDFSFPGYDEFCELHGTPAEDMVLWDPQDEPMSCAVAVTNSMFRSLGFDPGETNIADYFKEQGIYDASSGTDVTVIDDAVNILASRLGIDVQADSFSGCSVVQMEAMLDNGIKPLIAVDGAELYAGAGERCLNDMGLLPDAPHAIHLTGIEHTADGDFAVLNDPASGAGLRVPLATFVDAADDFGFSGVAMSDHATMARLDTRLGGADGEGGTLLGAAFNAKSVWADFRGNLFRGKSLIPFSGPSAPGWKWTGNTMVFQN